MQVNYRIDGGGEFLLKGFAWAVYGFNFVIVTVTGWIGIGLFLSPIFMGLSYIFLALWLKMKDIQLLDSRTGGSFIISGIISLIPVVNLLYFRLGKSGLPLPGIVGVTSRIIAGSQEEDEMRANKASAQSESDSPRYQRPSYRPNNPGSNNGRRYVDQTEQNQIEDTEDYEENRAA